MFSLYEIYYLLLFFCLARKMFNIQRECTKCTRFPRVFSLVIKFQLIPNFLSDFKRDNVIKKL